MLWIKMSLIEAGWKENTVVGNMVEKDATKRQDFIVPHALMNKRDFIIVMIFPR